MAVQALVILAETDGACSSGSMAQDLKAHAVYLRRVLAQLARANLIEAREGRDSGYHLARSAEDITLAEVYQALKVVDLEERTTGSNVVNARVQAVLDEIETEAEQQLLEVLGRFTIASILERVMLSDRPA